MKENVSNTILNLSKIFASHGKDLLLVGGCVRDNLMNREPKDFDLTTNATPDEIISMIDGIYNYDAFGKSYLVIVVFTEEHPEGLEIATFRSDVYDGKGNSRNPSNVVISDIKNDAKRRDFTINSLYYDLINDKVIDLTSGKKDIDNKMIRFVGEPNDRINEDPLRILRFFRFLFKYPSMNYSNKTYKSIVDNLHRLNDIVRERIVDEFIKGFDSAYSKYKYIKLLSKSGVLNYIFNGLKLNNNISKQSNISLYIAMLLVDNDISLINDVLVKKLKFTSNLLRELSFLWKFKNFNYSDIPSLKKTQSILNISNKNMCEWFSLIDANIKKSNAYLSYKPVTKADDLLAEGFSGKELGLELHKREMTNLKNNINMIHKIVYFKDIEQNNTIGINFLKSEVQTYIGQMYVDAGEEKGRIYNQNLLNRNSNTYHMTVISQYELAKLRENSNLQNLANAISNIFDLEITDLKIKGVGKGIDGYKVVYYIIVESETINDIRRNLLLPEKDLHITIGYSHNDLHNIKKNILLEEKNNFLDSIRTEYVKDLNSFDFIKNLKDFPGTELSTIEIVKLNDSWAQFRYDNNKYICVSFIDELKITSIFESNDKLRILSYTLVNKKLKINI